MPRILTAVFLLTLGSIASATDYVFTDTFEECGMSAVRSNLAITISPPQGASDLILKPAITLPITKGIPIDGRLVGMRGTPPYLFSEVTSNLAAFGITLNSDGTLTGTPSTVGHTSYRAKVQDAALGAFECTLSIRVHANLQVVAGSPLDGEKSSIYNYAFAISGATGAVTWAISPSLVITHGLYLHAATGVLDTTDFGGGTGAIIGSSDLLVNFTITATDAGSGDSLVIPSSIYIYGALDTPIVTPGYNVVVGVSTLLSDAGYFGGKPPFKFAVTSSLPSGLTVNFNPNDYTATVLATEAFDLTTVQFVVTDALGGAVPAAFDLTASAVSIDGAMAANSDSLFPTQAAVVAYVAAHSGGSASAANVAASTTLSATINRFTAGSVAGTTPASPADFDELEIAIEDASFTGCSIVAHAGQTVNGASSLSFDILPCIFRFRYNLAATNWFVDYYRIGDI